ncbi:MAG TPA: SPOR domain-containing protein [Solimonas sp.]
MARDYAQRSGGGRNQARSKGKGKSGGGMPGWVWLAAGLSVGLAVAALVYIQRPAGAMPGADRGAAAVAPDAATETRADGRKKKNAPIPLPPKEKERFTFYEILKGQEVVIPREEIKAAAPPSTVDTGTGSFLIQVASFRAQADAERQKASLALIGIESRIESVTIDNRETFYRVRIGPMSDWNRVQTTMTRLEENGISALVVKLR